MANQGIPSFLDIKSFRQSSREGVLFFLLRETPFSAHGRARTRAILLYTDLLRDFSALASSSSIMIPSSRINSFSSKAIAVFFISNIFPPPLFSQRTGAACENQWVDFRQIFTNMSITGTSMSTPTTVARAAPDDSPKSITDVAMATSK